MVPTDLEIAKSGAPRPIAEVAVDLGLSPDDLELYGKDKAKISFSALSRLSREAQLKRGKLVLVTAITPTRAGEGKTTVTIGLAQALWLMGTKSIAAIREPSLGPVFGVKGGATGGGYSQVVPMEDINLHFTGDMHAVAAANNLLCALVDNHIYHGNVLRLDSRAINIRRAVDMNDRGLRSIVQGLGGKANGYPRESGFDITAASEVMAVLCLANSFADLKARLERMVIGRTLAGEPVTANDLKAAEPMAALLRHAFKPNLVQTLEGSPAVVHGGPFGNIAHGCSSVSSIRLALSLGEVVVTEAGFGSDLGFEKFCDIVAAPRIPDLTPDAVVLVVTVRALKLHAGVPFDELQSEHIDAVKHGLWNLERHVSIVRQVGLPLVVTINRFSQDTNAEVAIVEKFCAANNWTVVVNDVWGQGGNGGRLLGEAVLSAVAQPGHFQPFYQANWTIMEKLDALARNVHGAKGVELEPEAKKELIWLAKHGFDHLPVCVAKTQYSFTDDPQCSGMSDDFRLHVDNFHLSAAAGFVVALMGNIVTMPGLPRIPSSQGIGADDQGEIYGLS